MYFTRAKNFSVAFEIMTTSQLWEIARKVIIPKDLLNNVLYRDNHDALLDVFTNSLNKEYLTFVVALKRSFGDKTHSSMFSWAFNLDNIDECVKTLTEAHRYICALSVRVYKEKFATGVNVFNENYLTVE